jgi:DNA-binding HxlR family transcriptional regulator
MCSVGNVSPCSETGYEADCPARHVLNVLVDKWAALILLLLKRQTMRFTVLHRHIRGISQKMLTQTLRRLERDGLVQRTVYAEVPPRVEYAITPLGRSLCESIAVFREWSDANVEDIIAAQRQYDTEALQEK